jgi:hypothetical protein
MGDLSDKGMQQIKSILAHHDSDTIMMATNIRAKTSGNKEEQEVALRLDAQLHEKLGDKAYGEKKREAQDLAGSMSGGVADAFERTYRGSRNVKDVADKLDLVSEAAGDKMKLAAQKEFKQKLDRVHKGAAGAGSVEEAVSMLTDDEMDSLDKQTREAIVKYRKGGDEGKAALNDAVARSAPSTTKVRHSDASSAKLDELDQQISDYEDEAAKASDQGTPEDLQSKATDLFANSVKDFAQAVKTLSGHSDNALLNFLNPVKNPQD